MATPAEILLNAANQDRSYAGAFAYESQTPHKVFMGQSPCVPLPTVMEVIQGSAPAGPGDMNTLRKVIGMDVASCSAQCTPQMHSCLASTSGNLADKMGSGKCLQETLSCYQSCLRSK